MSGEELELGLVATEELNDEESYNMLALFLLRALMIHGTVCMTTEQMIEASEVGLEKLRIGLNRETGVMTAALKAS